MKKKRIPDVQHELYKRGVKVTATTVYHWMKGRFIPKKEHMKAACEVLEMEPNDFYKMNEEAKDGNDRSEKSKSTDR